MQVQWGKDFLRAVEDDGRRQDAVELCLLMQQVTGEPPVMWGPSIVGFGTHDWITADGRATPWPIAAFSPRSTSLVVYLMPSFPSRDALLAKLGKHSIGKSCLYVKRLDDVHLPTLEALVTKSIAVRKAKKS